MTDAEALIRCITVLHGPNLNLLGRREVALYGQTTLAEIDEELARRAAAWGFRIRCFQENGEGELVRRVHEAAETAGLLLNAAGYTHTSVALRDAIVAVGIPTVEVHLTNIYSREPFRRRSLLAPVCIGLVCGFGPRSYYLALQGLIDHLKDRMA
ncbi:MAG: type II 3-dehydroquinate dehydratase [Myxococcales bacterium]|nr:type II 3-dehydroquinate dehydratase [Myxococcota bacterium]MDW8283791.1 type II 3-dehydroquinate dehydratase [Myxococcales bacterium]